MAAAVPLALAPAPLARVRSLTGREHEVLRWVATGKADRDIALILGISHRTVHKHLQSAYTKLGVENRTAAAMRLVARPTAPACPWLPRASSSPHPLNFTQGALDERLRSPLEGAGGLARRAAGIL
jgi:DNA-binding CsgD family transcriptional regulator